MRGAIRRLVAFLTFLVLFRGSMIAVDGVMMKLRSDWAAGRGGAIGNYQEAKKAVAELEAAMAAVGPARPVDEINALIDAHPIDMNVWRRSKSCQEISRDDTKKLCEPILALYQERGRAARRTELEPKLAEARSRLAGMDPPKSADPQAEAWAKATGWDETLVAYAIVAVLGLAIEIVACFGTWIAMQPPQRGSTGANDNRPPVPIQVPTGTNGGNVVSWVREFRRRNGRSPQIPELQRAFPGTPKTTAWRRCKAA